jgi:hypothetical protein
MVNSAEIYLLDPQYYDEKIVLLQIKGVIAIDPVSGIWEGVNNSVVVTEYWREIEKSSRSRIFMQIARRG